MKLGEGFEPSARLLRTMGVEPSRIAPAPLALIVWMGRRLVRLCVRHTLGQNRRLPSGLLRIATAHSIHMGAACTGRCATVPVHARTRDNGTLLRTHYKQPSYGKNPAGCFQSNQC